MKKIVIVDLAGGIGNQIFLFEIANFIGSIDNRLILMNKSIMDKTHSNGNSTIEDFNFPLHVRFFTLNKVIRKCYLKFGLFLKKYNRFRQSFFLVLDESYNLGRSADIRDIILNRNPKIILITGFWQNFAYWNNDFQYNLKIESTKYKQLSTRLSTEDPIVIHYRLGRIDGMLENPWGALSPNFLINSLRSLKINSENLKPVWIFSNDLNEAKKLLGTIDTVPYDIFLIDDSELRPSEIILLFSKSTTLICSNSTFSIVAARIGNVENVIVPSDLSNNVRGRISLPTSWKTVTSEWLDA